MGEQYNKWDPAVMLAKNFFTWREQLKCGFKTIKGFVTGRPASRSCESSSESLWVGRVLAKKNTALTLSCEDSQNSLQQQPLEQLTKIVRGGLEAMCPAALYPPVTDACAPMVPLVQAIVCQELANVSYRLVCTAWPVPGQPNVLRSCIPKTNGSLNFLLTC